MTSAARSRPPSTARSPWGTQATRYSCSSNEPHPHRESVNADTPTRQPNQPVSPTAPDRAPAPAIVSPDPVPSRPMPALTLLAADDALVWVADLCAPAEEAR